MKRSARSSRPALTRIPLYALSVLLIVAGGVSLWMDQFLIATLLGVSVLLLAVCGLVVGLRRARATIDNAASVLDPRSPSTQEEAGRGDTSVRRK
ncbi:hypothetical protein BH23ACT6_BH23ACT6_22380 [soil metagenome]